MEVTISLENNGSARSRSALLIRDEYTGYFQSKRHELAFYFKMNSPAFDKYLGIKKVHMVDANKARVLRNAYLSLFHPDANVKSEVDLDLNEVCEDINNTFHRVTGGKL